MSKISTSAGECSSEVTSSTCLAESTATLRLEVTDYLQFIKGVSVGDFVSSRVVRVGGHDWEIRFYPGGFNEDCAGHASVLLWCLSRLQDEQVRTEFTVSMLENKSQEQVAGFNMRKRVFANPRYNPWGYPEFVDKSKLESMSHNGDGCFTILCVLTVTHDSTPLELPGHFERMLRDGTGADVAFSVAGHEFRAHRSLMAARSPVFGAMLFGPTAEKKDMLRVEVVDVEPAIFKMLLHYIYTDSLPECEDEGGYSVAAMQSLLGAASTYGLDRLKLICEEELCKRIDQETITTTLALADQHRCKRLKLACDEFVSARK